MTTYESSSEKPNLIDLLQNLASDPALREEWGSQDAREHILDRYDLSFEQRNLIRYALDEDSPYTERQRAIGQAIENQFGFIKLLPVIC